MRFTDLNVPEIYIYLSWPIENGIFRDDCPATSFVFEMLGTCLTLEMKELIGNHEISDYLVRNSG